MKNPVKMLVIPPEGPVVESTVDINDLKALQAAVGGYVQVVPHFDMWYAAGQSPCIALCDEEGKLKGKPRNRRATSTWSLCYPGALGDVLVGDVVILIGDAKTLAKF